MQIFLTGATGLVGGEVLAKLSKRTEVTKIYCLIRAGSLAIGKARLKNIFDLHQDEFDSEKIIPVCGDLFDENLTRQLIANPDLEGITTIIHSAANTSFAKVKDALVEKANIGGLKKILEWATRLSSLQTFMYVGTATICGSSVKNRLVFEDESPNLQATHFVKYTYTKMCGEVMLREYLPSDKILIVRPSIIMGDSRGVEPRSPVILWTAAAMNQLRLIPCNADSKLDIVPVDFVANIITRLLFIKRNYDVYHISAGKENGTTPRLVTDVIADYFDELPPYKFIGKKMLGQMKLWAKGKLSLDGELYKYGDYLNFLKENFEELSNLRILFSGLDPYIEFIELGQQFDNSRIIEDLKITEPIIPAHVYIKNCLPYIGRINIMEGAIDP